MLVNKYSKCYHLIISNAMSRNVGDERHHIVPKSIGGSNDAENLVWLTHKEHFVCHHLLTKFTTGNDWHKMIYAFKLMAEVKQHPITSRVYGKLKADFKKVVSLTHKGKVLSVETKEKLRKHNTGKKQSVETRKKHSIARKGLLVGDKNPMYGKRHLPETIEKMIISRSGENHPRVEGYYVTPWGDFLTSNEASQSAPSHINLTSLRRWCKVNNSTKIRRQSYLQCEYLNELGEQVIGKTYREIGFGFMTFDGA